MDEQCFHNVFIWVPPPPPKQTLRQGLRNKKPTWEMIPENTRKGVKKSDGGGRQPMKCLTSIKLPLSVHGAQSFCRPWELVEKRTQLFLLRCELAGIFIQWFQSCIHGGLFQEGINSLAFLTRYTGSKVNSKSKRKTSRKAGVPLEL